MLKALVKEEDPSEIRRIEFFLHLLEHRKWKILVFLSPSLHQFIRAFCLQILLQQVVHIALSAFRAIRYSVSSADSGIDSGASNFQDKEIQILLRSKIHTKIKKS